MRNLVTLFLFIVLFTSCLPKEKAVDSTPQSSRWNISQNPFPLQMNISTDFSSNETADIRSASSNWDSAVGGGINFMDDSNSTALRRNINTYDLAAYQDSEFGIYKLNNWPGELPSSALAVTQLFGIRKNIGSSSEYIEINHADILVNYDNFTFTGDYDLQTVVLHEMGHFLGLFHENSSREESVMYPSISSFTVNRIPKLNDVSNLKSMYGISGGIATSANVNRSLASSSSHVELEQNTEAVVVLFELRADGQEIVTIKNQKTNKIISQNTSGCEHSL